MVTKKRRATRQPHPQQPPENTALPPREPIWVCVHGYKAGEHFAVTPSYDRAGYDITHMRTGSVLNDTKFSTVRRALAAASEIEALSIPWDQMRMNDAESNRALAGADKARQVKEILYKYSNTM